MRPYLPMLIFAIATLPSIARADVYNVDFSGIDYSDPFNQSPMPFSFTFDTGTLMNHGFEADSGFFCGTGGSDCFVASSSTGEAAIVYRDGQIVFSPFPAYGPSGTVLSFETAMFSNTLVPIFTGSDDAPHVLTGTYFADLYIPYTSYDGTATITDLTASSPVPEPSSLALLGTGILGGLAAIRRRFL